MLALLWAYLEPPPPVTIGTPIIVCVYYFFFFIRIAGQIAWITSIAPDSIKSVIQTSDKPLTIRETARTIYASRGIRGFFSGLGVAVLRAFPANAALFVGYEYTKKLLG